MRGSIIKKQSPYVRLYLLPPILKFLLSLGACVFLCVLGFFILYWQSSQKITNITRERELAESRVFQSAKTLAELQFLKKRTEAAKVQYQKLLATLPPESDVEDLLTHITKIGTEKGLKFVYFRPKKPAAYVSYMGLPVDIGVVGRYHQIGAFLSAVANLPSALVAVDTFQLQPVHQEKENSVPSAIASSLQLDFTATLYYALPAKREEKSP